MAPHIVDSSVKFGEDDVELARMGYKPELKRELGLAQNFGVSFSIISVITGVPSLFLYGLNTGGPAVMVWGWVVVAFFTALVGLSMGECCSAYPNSGGQYFWAAMISGPKYAPLASWITGWFGLLGQVASTTGVSFACSIFISTACTLGTSFVPTAKTTVGIYAAVLFSQGLINTFGVRFLKHLNNVSIFWHAIGTFSLVIAILTKASKHQSSHFVFATFLDGTGIDGVGWSTRASRVYVAMIGILMAQYTLTGFDASAHMAEETHNAAMAGPIGIVMSIGVSAVLGLFLILGLLFSIQDLPKTLHSPTGQPISQIFLDVVGEKGAMALMMIVIGAMYFCGTFCVTSNSRTMYAFARDGGIPCHQFFNKVNSRWKSPTRTVWLACTLSFLLGLPSLGSTAAFSAATSIATIGMYISYGIPIALRVIYSKQFVRGPFHLGAFSFPVAIASITWIAFISVVFTLPQINPVNSQTLNYSAVAVGIVVAYSVGFWLVSANKWFTGPIKFSREVESESEEKEDN